MAAAADGTVYFTEGGGHRVRKVRPDDVVLLVAGGTAGLENGPKAHCTFSAPHGPALDPRTLDDAHGPTLVVADTNNHCVRAVNATTGEARTLAGRGHAGFKDGKARRAEFAGPSDVAVAPYGTVFVADVYNHRVRVISPDGASVRTLAGAADAARPTARPTAPRGSTTPTASRSTRARRAVRHRDEGTGGPRDRRFVRAQPCGLSAA